MTVLVLLLMVIPGCDGALDGKRVRAEVETGASIASEAQLLAEPGQHGEVVASATGAHGDELRKQLQESLEKLRKGATQPTNTAIVQAALRVAHRLETALGEPLDQEQTSAELRALRAELTRLADGVAR